MTQLIFMILYSLFRKFLDIHSLYTYTDRATLIDFRQVDVITGPNQTRLHTRTLVLTNEHFKCENRKQVHYKKTKRWDSCASARSGGFGGRPNAYPEIAGGLVKNAVFYNGSGDPRPRRTK